MCHKDCVFCMLNSIQTYDPENKICCLKKRKKEEEHIKKVALMNDGDF